MSADGIARLSRGRGCQRFHRARNGRTESDATVPATRTPSLALKRATLKRGAELRIAQAATPSSATAFILTTALSAVTDSTVD